MKKKILIFVVSLVSFRTCIGQQQSKIKQAEWLVGTWENKTAKGSMYESWVKQNDSVLIGKGFMIKGKDTVVFESVRLVQERANLFYIPIVKNQNNGLPVRFALKTISNEKMVFENPTHDFPQVIWYAKTGADSLVAEISGVEKGKEHKETYPMKKIL